MLSVLDQQRLLVVFRGDSFMLCCSAVVKVSATCRDHMIPYSA